MYSPRVCNAAATCQVFYAWQVCFYCFKRFQIDEALFAVTVCVVVWLAVRRINTFVVFFQNYTRRALSKLAPIRFTRRIFSRCIERIKLLFAVHVHELTVNFIGHYKTIIEILFHFYVKKQNSKWINKRNRLSKVKCSLVTETLMVIVRANVASRRGRVSETKQKKSQFCMRHTLEQA